MSEQFSPTNVDVDAALDAIEAEESREREALRAFYARETARRQYAPARRHALLRGLAWFTVKVALTAFALWALLVLVFSL